MSNGLKKTDEPLVLGLLQHATPTDVGRDQAFATVQRLGAEAVERGATVLVTQELFGSAYFCQVEDERRFDLAEPIPGPTSKMLGALAREHGVVVVGSMYEKRAAGVYHNTTLTLGPDGQELGRYRKMHIPHDPRFYEKYYFTPGDAAPLPLSTGCAAEARAAEVGFHAVDTPAGRLGSLVCWDQWFPEAARLTALAGAQVLLYPTAIGYYNDPEHGDTELAPVQHDAWKTMMRSHAIANGVYVAAVNRVGIEDKLTFWGGSFVCDPAGVVIAEAGEAEQVLVVACPQERIESQRRGWPFLRDRRVDAYAGLHQRWRG